ncbi:MAG TPA: spore coat U domain-containing protein [Casimicrobiaceae bacterium]|nr:spore coat U domain-containing protein [Casimicrobiaceae bacterium]
MTRLFIRRKAAALCLSTGAAFLIALPANGATTTGNLGAGASVAANCSIATAAVAFGPYDPVVANAAAALTATGSITVACSKGSAPTITLDLGANAVGAVRKMANGAERLVYELYMPPNTTPGAACGALTTIWGTTGANIFTPTSPASKAARTYNVCGSIAANQDVGVGAYSDTVVASVNF